MRCLVIFGVLIGTIVWPWSPADAQNPFRRNRGDFRDLTETDHVTARIDRGVQQAIDDAQKLIKQQQFVPAVMRLQSVLDHPEDYFLEKDFKTKGILYPDTKGRTQQILAILPAEGRAAYELHFGTTARSLLNEAVRKNDLEQVAEVVRRYEMSAAGFDAMEILAASAFDHDRLLDAAFLCEAMTTHPRINDETKVPMLLRAAFAWHLSGNTEQSLAVLNALVDLNLPANWRMGGRPLPLLLNKSDAAEWLIVNFGPAEKARVETVQEWQLPRGGASGNESATRAFPIGGEVWSFSPLKQIRLSFDNTANTRLLELFDQLIHQISGTLHDHDRLTLPVATPIVAQDVIVVRTLNDVTAVNLRTGQLLWRSAVTDSTLSWLVQNLPADFEVGTTLSPTLISAYIRSKLFHDQLSGSLSSDGKYVYAIEESDLLFRMLRYRQNERTGVQNFLEPTNKLVAYELATGRLIWEIGGLRGTPPVELSGSLFLGPPLPFAGRLYCLAEMNDELRLLSLIPEENSVRLEWSQSLISINMFNTVTSPRRQVGVMPAIVDGLMICPTATGSIVAYDLVLRQLRWGYSYDLPRNNASPLDAESRWFDRSPLIANGRVVLSPVDSAELHCLNLADGTSLWKRPRRQGSYVACINDNAVIVVGRSQIVAYALANGTEVWSQPLEINEPSGRGVRVDSMYLLPLSTGEIATIDLSNGRIVGRSRLSDGRIPGNLAVCAGTLVSCGIHDVVGYRSLSEMEKQIARLTTSPNDAVALGLRGELQIHLGKQEDAISDLRKSVRLQPQPRVKQVLAETLLAASANNSKRLLEVAPELETLVDEPRQRIDFLRSYIRALNETGDRVGAVKQLFRLAAIPDFMDEMISESTGYSMTLWQHIRSQLVTAFDAGDAKQKLEIGQVFESEFHAAANSRKPERRLIRFANLTIHHPAADLLLTRLIESKNLLGETATRSRLLEQLTQSPDKPVAAFAVAKMAMNAIDEKRPRDALPWITELGRDYSAQICWGEKTGKQLSDELLALDAVRRSAVVAAKWPERPMQIQKSPKRRDGQERKSPSSFPVVVLTHVGTHFKGWSFELNIDDGVFTARDPSLGVAWQVQRSSFEDDSRVLATQLHIRGRRMAMSLGAHLIVMECTESATEPKVLFDQVLQSNSFVERRQSEFPPKRPLLPNGRRFHSDFEPRGFYGFLIGLSDEAVFYQVDNRLCAADVETGDLLWTRIGSTYAKSDATVDNLLTLHTINNDAVLLRTLDGTILQQHKGSLDELPLWFRGTKRLSQHRAGPDQLIFEMRDFDGDRVVWQTQHPVGTLTSIVDYEDFAVLEPSGKLTVFNLISGEAIVTAAIQLVRRHGDGGVLAVQRFQDRYIVFAGVSSGKSDLRSSQTFKIGVSADSTFPIDGSACAVNRSDGRVVWTVPIEQLAFDFTQPSSVPVLVLASRQSEMTRSGTVRISTMVIDKRTGRVAFEGEEPLPRNQEAFLPSSRGVQFIPKIDEEKLIVDFQDWNLEVTFPSESKVEKN